MLIHSLRAESYSSSALPCRRRAATAHSCRRNGWRHIASCKTGKESLRDLTHIDVYSAAISRSYLVRRRRSFFSSALLASVPVPTSVTTLNELTTTMTAKMNGLATVFALSAAAAAAPGNGTLNIPTKVIRADFPTYTGVWQISHSAFDSMPVANYQDRSATPRRTPASTLSAAAPDCASARGAWT